MNKTKTPKKKLSLFSLSRAFYVRSGTYMGMLYTVGTKNRENWGSVETALGQGISVSIRPANKAELLWAYTLLGQLEVQK